MLSTHDVVSELVPNPEFSRLASDEQIERAVQALEANGIHALVAENGEEATRIFFELVPEGAEVFLGASVTLEKPGFEMRLINLGDMTPYAQRCLLWIELHKVERSAS